MGLLMSFDDCPYGCTNGQLMDRKIKKLIPCPYCSSRKKELADKGEAVSDEGKLSELPNVLGVANEYMKPVFQYDLIIPEGERVFIEKESLDRQEEASNELYLALSVGQKPDRSYCFGLGNKGKIDRFSYPMLVKAYLSGMSVAKFISCTDYNRLLYRMSDDLDAYLESDFVMVLICDGSSKADISAVKGLMQSRALRGKATVFVTTWSIEACSMLLGYWEDPSLFLACGSFVEYKKSGKKSRYINQLTGVKNSIFYDEEEQGLGMLLEDLHN